MSALFINTRPSHKTTQLPIKTYHLPLLAIRHFQALEPAERTSLEALIQGQIDVLVVVSVEAVHGAVAFLGQYGIHHACDLPDDKHRPLCVIAVGEPTARALRAFGFAVVTPTDRGLTMNNEGMLAMPEIQRLTPTSRVLIWRGVGGRRLFADSLGERGVDVQAIAFYERGVPCDLSQRFAKLIEQLTDEPSPLFLLISSEMSLNAWRGVFDDWLKHQPSWVKGRFLGKNMVYLALGERLICLVKHHYPNNHVIGVADLGDETLARAIDLF